LICSILIMVSFLTWLRLYGYIYFLLHDNPCVVPKLLTLYTHHWRMGKKNKIVKLTPRKIRHIIRYKTNNYSTKSIAKDLKISESTIKRVWMHWIKTKTLLDIKKFGRKRKELDEASVNLILQVHKEQNLGARRLEAIIEGTIA